MGCDLSHLIGRQTWYTSHHLSYLPTLAPRRQLCQLWQPWLLLRLLLSLLQPLLLCCSSILLLHGLPLHLLRRDIHLWLPNSTGMSHCLCISHSAPPEQLRPVGDRAALHDGSIRHPTAGSNALLQCTSDRVSPTSTKPEGHRRGGLNWLLRTRLGRGHLSSHYWRIQIATPSLTPRYRDQPHVLLAAHLTQ